MKFRVPATSPVAGPRAGPGACRRSPATPSLPAAAYLAPRGRRGAHPQSDRRSVCCRRARSGRARVGGADGDAAGRAEGAETVRSEPRLLARFGTSRRRQPRPHPRPLPGDPRGPKGSLYQSCRDITRRPGSGFEGAGPRAGGGARGGGSAAWESEPRGAGPR